MYSISGGNENEQFQISQNGTIFTAKPLDRETQSLYNLVVMATDQAKAPEKRLSSTVQVSLNYQLTSYYELVLNYCNTRHWSMLELSI